MEAGQQETVDEDLDGTTNGRFVLLLWAIWSVIFLGGYYFAVKLTT